MNLQTISLKQIYLMAAAVAVALLAIALSFGRVSGNALTDGNMYHHASPTAMHYHESPVAMYHHGSPVAMHFHGSPLAMHLHGSPMADTGVYYHA